MKASLHSAHERLLQLQTVSASSEEEEEDSHGIMALLAKATPNEHTPSQSTSQAEHGESERGREGRNLAAHRTEASHADHMTTSTPSRTGSQLPHSQPRFNTTTLKPPNSSVGMIGYESLVRYPQLIQLCETLLRKYEGVISNLETLTSDLGKRRRILEQFWNAATSLQTWIKSIDETELKNDGTSDKEVSNFLNPPCIS